MLTMPIVIQANEQSSNKGDKQLSATKDSFTDLSAVDKHNVAEQLLSFKRVSPSPVPASGHNTTIQKLGMQNDRIENKSIILEIKKNNKTVKKKTDSKNDNSGSCGRLLPKHAVAILKEWILSPEHFSFPYPTEEEKKMLMEKTGINSKQIKYWFINARRRLWKQKLAEQQQKLPSSIIPNDKGHANLRNSSAINTPNPLSGANVDMNLLQHRFLHPNMYSILTMTPQQQTAATALLHQQILLQKIAAANTAAAQMASSAFVNSAFQQHRCVPNHVDRFVNVFLPKLTLPRQQHPANNHQFNLKF